MAPETHDKLSLYEEAKAGLLSLIQQILAVFSGFVLMLLITGGAPSSFAIALSFCLGTAFVSWSEQKRVRSLNADDSSTMPVGNQSGQINYNSAKGYIINQSGSFGVGVDKSKTQINNSQDLTQAAKDIKDLLDQLLLDYPNDSPRVLGAKALDEVEKSPELKSRILRGMKAGSFAALEKMVDHPVAKFFIEGAKEVLKP